jgi:nitrite reductase/ring-hydroxylating ferredoxin subunit
VSGYIYWRGGSKGLIIFRKTIDEFIAYDRHCTFEVDKNNQTSVDASGIIASDAACGSKFFLTDGSVNSGSASRPLKQYQVTFDGTVLHIFN